MAGRTPLLGARTLQEAILEQLQADPAHPALAFVDERGAFRWQSRAALHEHARAVAGALARLGLERERVLVAVVAEHREAAGAVLGALALGARPLLVAPPTIQGVHSSLGAIVRDVVRRSEAALVLLPEEMGRTADELEAAFPHLRVALGHEGWLAGGPPAAAMRRAPGDVAALQLTSGTTGFPRIAVWREERVLAALEGMALAMETRPGDVALDWTPLYHDMGLVNNLLHALVHGVPLALLSPRAFVRRPALWLRALSETGATTTWSPNFGYALAAERVRDGELEGVRLDGMRAFWNAAERIHRETCERFVRRFAPLGVRPEALRANFGCVETIGGATFGAAGRPIAFERLLRGALREEGVARAVAEDAPEGLAVETVAGCGRAHPGLELVVRDAAGRACPDGVVGDVCVRTRARFEGYLGQPDETERALRGDLVQTGDRGYLRGGELFWTGRGGEEINLAGRKLDPSELEPVLFAAAGLRKGSFAAFGREDPARGTEELVLVAEAEPQADLAATAAALRRALATGLGLSVDELALVARGTLTKTSSGKRRHRHFADLYLAGQLAVLHASRAGRL